jgi:Na+/H+ antiporter NhaD/arsenite permease-like protein
MIVYRRVDFANNAIWAIALRRENQEMNAWSFLKLGTLVMPPALLLAIAGLLIAGSVRYSF